MKKQPPYIAVVINDKQTQKARKDDHVEVQRFGIGEYGRYVMVLAAGKTVFMNPDNVEYFSDVSSERLAEIEAERQAFRDKGNAPVYVGFPDWESDKSIGIDFGKKIRLFFPRRTKKGCQIRRQTMTNKLTAMDTIVNLTKAMAKLLENNQTIIIELEKRVLDLEGKVALAKYEANILSKIDNFLPDIHTKNARQKKQ